MLVFTEYKDTANYTCAALLDAKIEGVGLATGDSENPTVLAYRFAPAPTRCPATTVATSPTSSPRGYRLIPLAARWRRPALTPRRPGPRRPASRPGNTQPNTHPPRPSQPWSSYGPNSPNSTSSTAPNATNYAPEHREQLADLRMLARPAEQRAEEHRDRADRAEALITEQRAGSAATKSEPVSDPQQHGTRHGASLRRQCVSIPNHGNDARCWGSRDQQFVASPVTRRRPLLPTGSRALRGAGYVPSAQREAVVGTVCG